MQEQLEREAIAISLKTSKLTAKTIMAAVEKFKVDFDNHMRKSKTPAGKQSVKKLMNHKAPVEIKTFEGDKGLFERVARKWKVDYAFYKTAPDKYLLLFKSGQADAIKIALLEYSNRIFEREKNGDRSILRRFTVEKAMQSYAISFIIP